MSDSIRTRAIRWVAYWLPRELIYWAGIRLMNWSAKDAGPPHRDPSKLTCYDALERWRS